MNTTALKTPKQSRNFKDFFIGQHQYYSTMNGRYKYSCTCGASAFQYIPQHAMLFVDSIFDSLLQMIIFNFRNPASYRQPLKTE